MRDIQNKINLLNIVAYPPKKVNLRRRSGLKVFVTEANCLGLNSVQFIKVVVEIENEFDIEFDERN